MENHSNLPEEFRTEETVKEGLKFVWNGAYATHACLNCGAVKTHPDHPKSYSPKIVKVCRNCFEEK